MSRQAKTIAYGLIKVILSVCALLAVVVGLVFYLDWSAARKARAFCDEVDLGTPISLAVAKAKDKNILQGTEQGYTFYFPGSMFNKAVCRVSEDTDHDVIAKHSEMERD